MPTQIQQLEAELAEDEARFGRDAPIVRALRQQLAAYKSMESGREERFLVGTRSAPPPAEPAASTTSTPTTSASDTGGATTAKSDSPKDETEADGKHLGAMRLARWRHQNDQLKKS